MPHKRIGQCCTNVPLWASITISNWCETWPDASWWFDWAMFTRKSWFVKFTRWQIISSVTSQTWRRNYILLTYLSWISICLTHVVGLLTWRWSRALELLRNHLFIRTGGQHLEKTVETIWKLLLFYPHVGGRLEVATSLLSRAVKSLKEKEGIPYQMMMMIGFDLVLLCRVLLQL